MKEKINRQNYEVFMIDYLDGTLSQESGCELLAFLDENLDLKEELEGIGNMHLVQDTNDFSFKSELKKAEKEIGNLNEANFEEYCVAYYEGDLNAEEKSHLKNYISENANLNSVFEAYASICLEPQLDVAYRGKDDLREFSIDTAETIGLDNYTDFLIANYEGDLNDARKEELVLFMERNPNLHNEAEQYAYLTLKPDESIIFTNKASLKRKLVLVPLANHWMNVAAASVAIIMVFFYTLPPQYDTYTVNPKQRKTLNSQLNITTTPIFVDSVDNNAPIDKGHTTATTPRKTKRDHINVKPVPTIAYNQDEARIPIEVAAYPMEVLANYDTLSTSSNNAIAQNNMNADEKEYQLNGTAGRIATRVGRLLGKSDKIKRGRIKNQFWNLAEYAVVGYNAMTESEHQLSRPQPDEEDN